LKNNKYKLKKLKLKVLRKLK